MRWKALLDGIIIKPLKKLADERGFFTEIFRKDWKELFGGEDIVQSNMSITYPGRISFGKNSVVKKGAIVRGPSIIGNNSIIESFVHIGPYTGIGNSCNIKRGEIENSIVISVQ